MANCGWNPPSYIGQPHVVQRSPARTVCRVATRRDGACSRSASRRLRSLTESMTTTARSHSRSPSTPPGRRRSMSSRSAVRRARQPWTAPGAAARRCSWTASPGASAASSDTGPIRHHRWGRRTVPGFERCAGSRAVRAEATARGPCSRGVGVGRPHRSTGSWPCPRPPPRRGRAPEAPPRC